jgi:hypothetical protein
MMKKAFFDDGLDSGSENEGVGMMMTSDEVTETSQALVALVDEIQPSGCFVDREWLECAQTHLLLAYCQENHLTPIEEDSVAYSLVMVRSELSNEDCLCLTKVMGQLIGNQMRVENESSIVFLTQLLHIGFSLSYDNNTFMKNCLMTLVSLAIKDQNSV